MILFLVFKYVEMEKDSEWHVMMAITLMEMVVIKIVKYNMDFHAQEGHLTLQTSVPRKDLLQ